MDESRKSTGGAWLFAADPLCAARLSADRLAAMAALLEYLAVQVRTLRAFQADAVICRQSVRRPRSG